MRAYAIAYGSVNPRGMHFPMHWGGGDTARAHYQSAPQFTQARLNGLFVRVNSPSGFDFPPRAGNAAKSKVRQTKLRVGESGFWLKLDRRLEGSD